LDDEEKIPDFGQPKSMKIWRSCNAMI